MNLNLRENWKADIFIIIAIIFVFYVANWFDGQNKYQCPEVQCYSEFYDQSYVAFRLPIVNFTYPKGAEWDSACEALEFKCKDQGNETSQYFTTNFDCEWVESEKTCECFTFDRNGTDEKRVSLMSQIKAEAA